MKPKIKLASAHSPDGTVLELFEHDGDHEILVGGHGLMESRKHHSEEELARLACADLPPAPVVMIGGLGMGYTLRATLDLLPADGRAIQVEILPEIVEWNRGPLAHHADHPLDDPRTELVVEDIAEVVKRQKGTLAAIMLDVDNGPAAMVEESNAWLYTLAGLTALKRALLPGGLLAVWSASDEPALVGRMRSTGLRVHAHTVYARPRKKGPKYAVIVGQRPRPTGS